jgi:hypothetical protein
MTSPSPAVRLRWVWPQHPDDDVARVALDEGLAHRSPPRGHWGEASGRRYGWQRTPPARCRRNRGSRSVGWSRESMWPRDRLSDPLSSSRHTMCPYLARQLSGFSTAGSKFMSIVRRARMVSSGDNKVYTGSGLRGGIPYVQCVVAVFLSQVCSQ